MDDLSELKKAFLTDLELLFKKYDVARMKQDGTVYTQEADIYIETLEDGFELAQPKLCVDLPSPSGVWANIELSGLRPFDEQEGGDEEDG